MDDDSNGYTDDSLGWNFGNNTPFNDPYPNFNPYLLHGTHMAAIIGSETDSTNDCLLIAGINWRCKLMNLRTDSSWISNDTLNVKITYVAVASAIRYAAINGAKVINLSLGREYSTRQAFPDSLGVITNALNYAYGLGVVSVAAIGNRADNIYDWYPGTDEKALGVGATRYDDNRVTPASYYGWESDYSDSIDLVAPGWGIFTEAHPVYPFVNGTSPSTAIVSGIASLVITHRKKLIPGEVLAPVEFYEVLRHTADDTVGHTYEDGDTLWPERYSLLGQILRLG